MLGLVANDWDDLLPPFILNCAIYDNGADTVCLALFTAAASSGGPCSRR